MKTAFRSLGLACVATGALLGASFSWAQDAASKAHSHAQGGQQHMTCDGKQQDRAACLSNPGPGTEASNALARCQLQPMADRADCEARIKGTGQTSAQGSVMGGGMIRETVTPVPAPSR